MFLNDYSLIHSLLVAFCPICFPLIDWSSTLFISVYLCSPAAAAASDTAGNETVKADHILKYLNTNGFDLFVDVWAENHLYFGKQGDTILDIDRLFGSKKFKLGPDPGALEQAAKNVLQSPIDPATWNQKKFLSQATDIIAIERTLVEKMKLRWLPWNNK